jgi:hypothetical protein
MYEQNRKGGNLMGFLGDLIAGVAKAAGVGRCSLKAAYEGQAPNRSGVYKVYYEGQLMKVGKAEDGLRKRFSDYYRGTSGGTAGLSYIDENNRDEITVSWMECSKSNL